MPSNLFPITLIALGPGHPDLLTRGAERALLSAPRLVLRTARHGVAADLTGRGVAFETLDALYEANEDFDALASQAADFLLARAAQGEVAYAVSDPAADQTVAALLARLPQGAAVRVLPGVTLAAYAQSGVLAQSGAAACPPAWRISDALTLPSLPQEPEIPLLITEIGSALLASEAKLWLLERYPAELSVCFAAPAEAATGAVRTIPLAELDRQPGYDHTTAVFIPAVDYRARARFGFADLVRIMQVLRGPDGCPWDKEQTHASLRPYLIEEAYEAVDAIDSGDPFALADELGDVLLQIVFHAQVGAEHASFAIDDVTSAVCQKMIARHEHIFGSVRCDTAEDVLKNWDKIKQKERGQQTQAEVLRAVPRYLPALMRAAKVQKQAANVGFDWDDPRDALQKVLEEAAELREELEAGRDPAEEAGDLLFAAVNALRLAKVEPELALAAATEKFTARFTRMEAAILADGGEFSRMTLPQMDAYWEKIKREEG